MENDFQTVIQEIVEQLAAHTIQYCLVGGLAATLRGRMRNTEDVDLVIATDVDEAIRFLHALPSDQFGPLFPEVEQVARTACILALEHVQTRITLDLAIGMSGFEQQIVRRSESILIAGKFVNVATAEDLILMKILAGRPQDQQDIEGIVASHRDTIDWEYCETVARQLEEAVADDFVTRIQKLRR
jgi:predicted nucleotidyltransferase